MNSMAALYTRAEKGRKAEVICIKCLPEIVLDQLNRCNFSPNYYHVLWVINFKQLLIIALV